MSTSISETFNSSLKDTIVTQIAGLAGLFGLSIPH